MIVFRAGVVALMALWAGCATARGSSAKQSQRDRYVTALERGQAAHIIDEIEREFLLHKSDLTIAQTLVFAHVQLGTHRELIKRFEHDDSAVGHYVRGLVLYAQPAPEIDLAFGHFRHAIERAPNESEFHFRLGIGLVESERFDEAVQPLTQALSSSPTNRRAQLALALALARSGNERAAITHIAEVVRSTNDEALIAKAIAIVNNIHDPFRKTPASARSVVEKAMSELASNTPLDQTIVLLEELALSYPDLAIGHTLLGLAYAKMDDVAQAINALKTAAKLDPSDGHIEYDLGEIYFGRGGNQTARGHYERAVELNPTLSDAWFKLGEMSLAQNDLANARIQFEMAAKIDRRSKPSAGKLALVYQLQTDYVAADRELRRALTLDSEDVEFQLRLGLLHTEKFLKATSKGDREIAADEARIWLTQVLAKQSENVVASRALQRLNDDQRRSPSK